MHTHLFQLLVIDCHMLCAVGSVTVLFIIWFFIHFKVIFFYTYQYDCGLRLMFCISISLCGEGIIVTGLKSKTLCIHLHSCRIPALIKSSVNS